MLLSIIIPVYNVEDYISECLASLFTNEHIDFEICCIDDCGVDGSMDIVENYAEIHPEIKIFYHEINKGLSAARNTGMKNARGDYLLFLDSDDLLKMENVIKLIDIAVKNSLDIIEANCGTFIESIDNCNCKEFYTAPTDVMNGDDYFTFKCKNDDYLPMVCVKLYRREFLIDNNLKMTEGILFEDEDFTPRAMLTAKKVMCVDLLFYFYRRREGSITTIFSKSSKWCKYYNVVAANIIDFCNSREATPGVNSVRNRAGQISLNIAKNIVAYNVLQPVRGECLKYMKDMRMYKYAMCSPSLYLKLNGIFLAVSPCLYMLCYKCISSIIKKILSNR